MLIGQTELQEQDLTSTIWINSCKFSLALRWFHAGMCFHQSRWTLALVSWTGAAWQTSQAGHFHAAVWLLRGSFFNGVPSKTDSHLNSASNECLNGSCLHPLTIQNATGATDFCGFFEVGHLLWCQGTVRRSWSWQRRTSKQNVCWALGPLAKCDLPTISHEKPSCDHMSSKISWTFRWWFQGTKAPWQMVRKWPSRCLSSCCRWPTVVCNWKGYVQCAWTHKDPQRP